MLHRAQPHTGTFFAERSNQADRQVIKNALEKIWQCSFLLRSSAGSGRYLVVEHDWGKDYAGLFLLTLSSRSHSGQKQLIHPIQGHNILGMVPFNIMRRENDNDNNKKNDNQETMTMRSMPTEQLVQPFNHCACLDSRSSGDK
jgi:hypothetical protein